MSQIHNFLTGLSFVMLCVITWGSKPIQALAEKTNAKARVVGELQGRKLVCDKLRAMQSVYIDWVSGNFVSGCLWEKRNRLLTSAQATKNDKDREFLMFEIQRLFQDTEEPKYQEMANSCRAGASAYLKEGRITERMVRDLYVDTLDCPSIYSTLDSLGIKETEEE